MCTPSETTATGSWASRSSDILWSANLWRQPSRGTPESPKLLAARHTASCWRRRVDSLELGSMSQGKLAWGSGEAELWLKISKEFCCLPMEPLKRYGAQMASAGPRSRLTTGLLKFGFGADSEPTTKCQTAPQDRSQSHQKYWIKAASKISGLPRTPWHSWQEPAKCTNTNPRLPNSLSYTTLAT